MKNLQFPTINIYLEQSRKMELWLQNQIGCGMELVVEHDKDEIWLWTMAVKHNENGV